MARRRALRVLVSLLLLLMLGSYTASGTSTPSRTTYNMRPDPQATTSESGRTIQSAPSIDQQKILYLSNVTSLQSTAKQVAEFANASVIQSVISSLSVFDNRYTGTQGSLESLSYIIDFLRVNCSIDKVYLDNFTFDDAGALIQASNVVAEVDAVNLTSRTLLVTAHHDSIGCEFPFNVYTDGARGSDDDASGVGAVLETARILTIFRQYLRCNILLIIFAAEEGNKTTNQAFMQQGSRHWTSANHMGVISLQDIVGAVNLDEIAYKDGGAIGVYHQRSGNGLAENITSTASILGIPIEDEERARTDAFLVQVRCRTEESFDIAGIPAVTLSSHYSDPFTHTTQDTVSNLDFGRAVNFTRTVLSYIFLTCGVTPRDERTYAGVWIPEICPQDQYVVNEANYIDFLIRPGGLAGYQLIILDPSLSRIDQKSLLSLASASGTARGRPPILAIGAAGTSLIHLLAESKVEYVEQYCSSGDLIAYVNSSLVGLGHHPIYAYPNKIAFTEENGSTVSYKVVTGRDSPSSNSSYFLARDATGADTPFLRLSCTSYAQEQWSWLGVLHAHNASCGAIGFIGIDNASNLTPTARNIASNLVYWLLNGQKTAVWIEASERNPLVGDHVNLDVILRDSLTWSANSSITVSLTMSSPSGKLLLREVQVTDQDGIARSSNILLAEIGKYNVDLAMLAEVGMGGLVTAMSFEARPRINAYYENSISIVQGESANIQLNLLYVPMASEPMLLMLRGSPLCSNLSAIMTFIHGSNCLDLEIPTREVISPGEYNLTLAVMQPTMEYVACEYSLEILITPGYDLEILNAPETLAQGSLSQLLIRLTSHRTVAVNGTLRIDSTNIVVTGETTFSIPAGASPQITLQIKEASASPYCWGQGQMKITLIRDGSWVAESRPISILVGINPLNIFVGYILPPSLLLAVLIECLRKTNVKRAGIGTLLGGSIFFGVGLVISQSMFLVVPLAMMILGSYLGTAVVEHVYDEPLPRGYNWHTATVWASKKMKNHRQADEGRSQE